MKICRSQDNPKRKAAKIISLMNQNFRRGAVKATVIDFRMNELRIIPKSSERFPGLGQAKAENIAAGGNGHVLFFLDRVGHRRRANDLPGIEVPQRFAG